MVLGARRREMLERVAEACGPDALALDLDVTDTASVQRFADRLDAADALVNNAGLALGRDPLEDLDLQDAATMWSTNVAGTIAVTQRLLPMLEASGRGHVVNIGSTAGFETYAGGGGYTATKHALRALTRTLRLELLGRPVRVTEIAPGLVETGFSEVRFKGDRERAASTYEGLTPLSAEDVADAVEWVLSRPAHVNIDEIVMRPLAQATSNDIHRAL